MIAITGTSAAPDYTDALGRTAHYDLGTDGIPGIKLPGSATNDVFRHSLLSQGRYRCIGGVTTTYSYAEAGTTRTTTVTRGSTSPSFCTFDTSDGCCCPARTSLTKQSAR